MGYVWWVDAVGDGGEGEGVRVGAGFEVGGGFGAEGYCGGSGVYWFACFVDGGGVGAGWDGGELSGVGDGGGGGGGERFVDGEAPGVVCEVLFGGGGY